MDEESRETLRMIKENDNKITELYIGDVVDDNYFEGDIFNSSVGGDFSTLGQYIGTNTHLNRLEVNFQALVNINTQGFFDGLQHNSSICKLHLEVNNRFFGSVGNDILSAYADSSSLTHLCIRNCFLLQNEVEHVAITLQCCTNLKSIDLGNCRITGQKLIPIVEAIRERSSLEEFNLLLNRIGNEGCDALATLLSHPNCNLQEIQISYNNIGNEGAITIANSLANNTKLKNLFLTDNPIDRCIEIVFYNLLCNKTSISSIYNSNHTLRGLYFSTTDDISVGHELSQLLIINGKMNKSHVAMKKILKYNNLDMTQLYNWDSENEYSLKALPFVIDWFENARGAVPLRRRRFPGEVIPGRRYNIDERKLSAIYQFARDMPLLFIPASHINGSGRVLRRSKRKRVGR